MHTSILATPKKSYHCLVTLSESDLQYSYFGSRTAFVLHPLFYSNELELHSNVCMFVYINVFVCAYVLLNVYIRHHICIVSNILVKTN